MRNDVSIEVVSIEGVERRMMRLKLIVFAWILASLPMTVCGKVDFVEDVKPILESRCLRCHNPNNDQGDLSLAGPTNLFGTDRSLVVPGEPLQSELFLTVIPDEVGARPRMPKEGSLLSDAQVRILRQWILEGASWPPGLVLREASRADASWWAYQPIKRANANTQFTTIDHFIRAQLEATGIVANRLADRRTLIRRATYDLTGLPPTVEEVEAFVKDRDSHAFEKLVDRLLGSPRYGERWGRHWLDVIRFGESRGYEQNHLINEAWPFRDYVIESINEDKAFDQLIREHLAGDVFGKGDLHVTIGSAFLVAGPADSVGNQDPIQKAQTRANTLDEVIRATGETFLGLTIGCSRCHDHKFDPITQRDYYQFYATFAGIEHGTVPWATPEQLRTHAALLEPLHERRKALQTQQTSMDDAVVARARKRLSEYERQWLRPAVQRTGTEERFDPVVARYVRLICDMQDENPLVRTFNLDEFEVWSTGENSYNVALAVHGATARGAARTIEDFPHAYGPQLTIDGKFGERFLSAAESLTIELAKPVEINRVFFSSARGEEFYSRGEFRTVADYRIQVSLDGHEWTEVAAGSDRKPANEAHQRMRLYWAELSREEQKERDRILAELDEVDEAIGRLPPLPQVWLGSRDHADGVGPFHVFVSGNPQQKGDVVLAASLSTLGHVVPKYELSPDADEAQRRLALAEWITHPDNPLTARVLANRIWHYHFGTGIVDTPSDFGYMGGRPTHPELLDFLAARLQEGGWKLKDMHRLIMLSDTYQQASTWRAEAAEQDGEGRLLWRFPPRRLSAEEIRDTMLVVAGQLETKMGGPGFRLYRYLRDNVSTYLPLDRHDRETYRRAVYHQNARASVVDLMTEYDQPDCTFSTPRRVQTTSPLQALTMLNHSFTLDMANAFAVRIGAADVDQQARRAFQLAYQRDPRGEELTRLRTAIRTSGLRAVCRAILNSSELIFLD